jgi:hypothetical protein
MHTSKISIEIGALGISKLTLEAARGDHGLRFLRNSLPAIALFDGMLPRASEIAERHHHESQTQIDQEQDRG